MPFLTSISIFSIEMNVIISIIGYGTDVALISLLLSPIKIKYILSKDGLQMKFPRKQPYLLAARKTCELTKCFMLFEKLLQVVKLFGS